MKKAILISDDSQQVLGQALVRLSAELQTKPQANAGDAVTLLRTLLGGGSSGQALVAAFAVAVAYKNAPLDPDATVLDEEALATHAANAMVLPIQRVRFQAQIDAAEAAHVGGVACSVKDCDGKAVSHGRKRRSFLGSHGSLAVRLRRVTCNKLTCGKSRLLAAGLLGLGDDRVLPGCCEAITTMTSTVPYGKAVDLLGKLMHIDISEHAAQDLTEARGAALLALDLAAANDTNPVDESGLARVYARPTDAVPEADAPDVVYLETDGVLPMTRELLPEKSTEVAGARGGKGRKFKLEGREVKNAVLYTAKAHAQEMPSRGCILRKHYVSYLGHWAPFALLVWLTMLRLRYDQAKLLVVLGDGAEWIRSFAKWLPMPKRVLLILDFYHAAHRVWELCASIYGDGTDLCRQKAKMWCEVIEAGHVAYIIDELKNMRDNRPAVQEKIDTLFTYFTNNADRMDYEAYRSRGLRITSGIVESANFHVTGARLKQQGMRWSEAGARELALLRADLCSDRWAARTRQLLESRKAA